MTLPELIRAPIEQLEAMSDKELEEFFAPYFNVTRPELAAKLRKTSSGSTNNTSSTYNSKIEKARAIATQFGFDLDDVL